jgi:hypothetical protein
VQSVSWIWLAGGRGVTDDAADGPSLPVVSAASLNASLNASVSRRP